MKRMDFESDLFRNLSLIFTERDELINIDMMIRAHS